MKDIKVLIVDDDDDDYFLITEHLKDINDHNFNILWASTYDQGVKQIINEPFDICLVDFLLGNKTGLDLLRQVRRKSIDTPIILLTGRGNREIDHEAMITGATDYLIKSDLEANTLGRSIRYAISHASALKAVKASERLYRNIFNRSRDMIYLADTGKGKFIDVNEQGTLMFGFSHEEFMGISTNDLLFDKSEKQKITEALITNGEIHDFETTLLTKSGEKRICIINGIFYTEGDTMYHHGSIHDVTDLRQMERSRMNVEKLAATGRFTRALAHEVRNPLTNIDLSVEQLEMDNIDEELTDYIAIIKRNSLRIGKLITELLQTSNPAQVSLKKQPLHNIIEKAIEANNDRVVLKNIKVNKSFTAENPHINADELRLQIAFSNLIVNAVEAAEEHKGILKIETEITPFTSRIIIEDNGCGMSLEQQNRLFEPYFTGKPKGMGLGMITTMNIIQSHGGEILFTSEKNLGTRFTLTFPLA